MGQGPGISVGDIQATLDTVYTKVARRAANQASVLSLFNANHLHQTGVTGPGMAGRAVFLPAW